MAWIYAVIWVLLVIGFVVAYTTGQVHLGTLVTLEILALALGIIAASFWWKATHPPESVEEVLYRTDHSAPR